MPIFVTERWSPTTVGFTSNQLTAARVFDVTGVASESAAKAEVIGFDASTQINLPHPQNAFMYSQGPFVAKAGFNVYEVRVNYASAPAGRHFDPSNVLNEPVAYRWAPFAITQSTDRDTGGNLLVNAAGEPFADAVSAEIFGVRITAVRYEAWFNANSALNYYNSVNNANVSYKQGQWGILELGQSRVVTIEPVSEITSSSPYVAVQYNIELLQGFVKDSDGFWDAFKLRIKNAGRRGWYDNSGTPTRGNIVQIIDGQIQNVDQDVLLDATGKPLFPEYKIAKTNLSGFATPIANPSVPSYLRFETTSAGVVFIKAFPDKVKLRDHNALGL